MIHYFPELAALSTVAVFALSDPEVGRYLRSSNIHVKSEANTLVLRQLNCGSVLREISHPFERRYHWFEKKPLMKFN